MHHTVLNYEFVLLCGLVGMWYHPTNAIESVFLGRSKPGLNDRLKLWWAKEVTPDYHIAGRLSERQIKYASEGGFKSIVSLYDDKTPGSFGGDYLPTGKQAKEIAEQQSGLQFAYVLLPNADWRSVTAVKKMAVILSSLKKPVLLYSYRGYTVTFVLLMHLANLTRQDPAFEPKIDSNIFYKMTAVMGMDFTKDTTKITVSEITGEPVVKDPPVTNVQPKDWLNYWMAHPVYKNWYTSGQIMKTHMHVLVATGVNTVINMRLGLFHNSTPSQEEVNLLNIPERTGTYGTVTTKPRQSKERLEETRVDPTKSNSYISPESNVNYESKNEAEFGDDVGYNANLEETAFKRSILEYHHFPAGARGPWEPFLDRNVMTIVEVAKRGPILIQCSRASRSSILAILGAAMEHNLDLDWALMKSRDLGFPITEEKTPEIYKTMKKFIDRRNESSSATSYFLYTYFTIFLSVLLPLSLHR